MVYIMEVTNNSIYKESRVILLSITFVLNNFPSQEQEGFQALLWQTINNTCGNSTAGVLKTSAYNIAGKCFLETVCR